MNRLLLLGLLAFALLFAGLASRSGAVLALLLPLVVYLGAALLYGPEALDLRVVRTLSTDRAAQDAPVAVTVALTNAGEHLEEVLVEDVPPSRLRSVEGGTRALVTLAPGETFEWVYTARAPRGLFEFDAVRVTACDRLGLFCRRATLSAPASLTILPESRPLRRVPIRPRRTRGYAGPVPARAGGSGTDFYGLREYQVGDPRRWINWRASARHPRALFTNEFQQERIADVGLILDARRRSDVRAGAESLFEHAIRATASLADTFLSDGNRVGLLIYGRVLDWTFPGYGKLQRERILRALAHARTGDSLVFDQLDYLPLRYFPLQSQLVLVSPLWRDDVPMLVRLRARGYQVLVVRPDPVSLELRTLASRPSVELAARLVHVERTLLRRRLRGAGIQVIDWSLDVPFEQAVGASLARMPRALPAVGPRL